MGSGLTNGIKACCNGRTRNSDFKFQMNVIGHQAGTVHAVAEALTLSRGNA